MLCFSANTPRATAYLSEDVRSFIVVLLAEKAIKVLLMIRLSSMLPRSWADSGTLALETLSLAENDLTGACRSLNLTRGAKSTATLVPTNHLAGPTSCQIGIQANHAEACSTSITPFFLPFPSALMQLSVTPDAAVGGLPPEWGGISPASSDLAAPVHTGLGMLRELDLSANSFSGPVPDWSTG